MFWRHIERIFAGLLVFTAILACAGFIFIKTSHARLLSVQSGSMVPALHRGDLVAVTRVPNSQLKTGDVITFINPTNKNQTITHRILNINGQKIQTKGDANKTADNPISISSVVGKVVYHAPKLGTALDFTKKPLGLFLIIYLPALAIFGSEVRRLADYYKKQQPYSLAARQIQPKSLNMQQNLANGVKLTGILIVAGLMVALPARAALQNKATLTGNTISTINLSSVHLLISEVNLRCSEDNTRSANRRPVILLSNPTNLDINISGWKIKDNSGTIITISNGTTIHKNKKLSFTPFLSSGLQYAGDRLELIKNTNVNIDGISWGTDISEFNPSITGVSVGARLKRDPPSQDTNTKADWKVVHHQCDQDDEHQDPGDHDGHHDDEDGDHSDSDARNELDRTHVVGMYHSIEEDN